MKKVLNETKIHRIGYPNNIFKSIIDVFFGMVEFILATRLLLKLFGASNANVFVDFVYSVTNFLVKPFQGIIKDITINTNMTLEPATIIAILLVAFIAWAISSLFPSNLSKVIDTTETTNFN